MKHQTEGTGRPSGSILDFRAGLPEVWGSKPVGKKNFLFVNSSIFPVFVFKDMHRLILLSRFCKLLTTVAIGPTLWGVRASSASMAQYLCGPLDLPFLASFAVITCGGGPPNN